MSCDVTRCDLVCCCDAPRMRTTMPKTLPPETGLVSHTLTIPPSPPFDPAKKHIGDVVQLYAFPEKFKARQRQEEQQRQVPRSGEGPGSPEGVGAAAGDAVMEDAAGVGGEASNPFIATSRDVGEKLTSPEAGPDKEAVGGRDGGGKEEGLPVLLLRELASFKARFSQRVGKHLRADAADEVLKKQVRGNADGITQKLSNLRSPSSPPIYFTWVGLASIGNDTVKHAAHYSS